MSDTSAYSLRQWWLDRFTLEQIRELFGPAFGPDDERVSFVGRCEWCGDSFTATKAQQPRKRFCCVEHQKAAGRSRSNPIRDRSGAVRQAA